MPDNELPSLADDIVTYLIANGVAVRRKTIFANAMPPDRNDCFLISDTAGDQPTQDYPIDHPGAQIAYYAGASNHGKGRKKIMDAYHLLNRKQNITVGTSDVMAVKAIQSPYSLGLDKEKKRWVFVFNIIAKVRGADGA